MAVSARVRRALDRVDRDLSPFEFGPAYTLSDGEKSLLVHVDCTRCGASVRIGESVERHWRSHHRLRAALIHFLDQRRAARSAKPVHSVIPTEPREDRT